VKNVAPFDKGSHVNKKEILGIILYQGRLENLYAILNLNP
jgi:hypothetical protein